jgi:competence protein ComEC
LAAVALWTAVGFLSSYRVQAEFKQEDERELACTIVSVGHGNAVLVELPNGKTLLYDCGRLGSPSAGARAICSVLWSRGITHLNAVVLSHADVDHYNALPELLDRVSVGVVYVSPVMFQQDSAALDRLQDSIREAGVPIRHLAMGDRLDAGGGATIDVLHPPSKGVVGIDSDNANSIVLLVEYEGRRILLPGDLVSPGLDDVIAEQPIDCDVVLAPHHGSAGSDPVRFTAWSTPEWVVISAGQNDRLGPVKRIFRESGAEVLHTQRSGAVRVTISSKDLKVQAWRIDPW